MSNLIDGEVTEKTTKRPPLWRRFLGVLDSDGRWSGLAWWGVLIVIMAPALLWRWWIAVAIAWGVGFAVGWWAARKHWEKEGHVPRL